MQKLKRFAYDLDMGSVADFADGRFMLVIKDEVWTEEELILLKRGIRAAFCYVYDIAVFVIEGGDIDSSDFYFNIQDCDEAQSLLEQKELKIQLILLNKNNEICFEKEKVLDEPQTSIILECLTKQKDVQFMPGEYEVNLDGLQEAYEPYELLKYEKCNWKM